MGWWITFCVLAVGMECILLFLDEYLNEEDVFWIIPVLMFMGGILFGMLLGGFWWVLLGITTGLLFGLITGFAWLKVGKPFSVLMSILMPVGGISFGIIFGGFWWILLGLLISGIITAFIIVKTEYEDSPVMAACISMLPVGGIFFGIVFKGFWWIVLGVLAGFLLWMISMSALEKRGKQLAIPLTLLLPAGAIIAYIYLGNYITLPIWLIPILGAAAGALLSFLIYSPFIIHQIIKVKIERRREELKNERIQTEIENIDKMFSSENYEVALDLIEHLIAQYPDNKEQWLELREQAQKGIYQKKPIEEKLALLDIKITEKKRKNEKKIKAAENKYIKYSENKPEPEELLNDFNKHLGEGYGTFNFLNSAKLKYNKIVEIANYFNARCKISKMKAITANDEYMFICERALIYLDELKKIISKLSIKDRKLIDTAKEAGLIKAEIKTDDNFAENIDAMLEFEKEVRWDSFKENSLDTLKGLGNLWVELGEEIRYKQRTGGNTNIETAAAGIGVIVFLGSVIGNAISDTIESIKDAHRAKLSLKEEELKRVKDIDKIEAMRFKAEAFYSRVGEINKSLTKTIEAYDKIFFEIKEILFPKDDETKTYKAREEKEKNGEPYFSENEKKDIMKLCEAASILASLVDTKL